MEVIGVGKIFNREKFWTYYSYGVFKNSETGQNIVKEVLDQCINLTIL